MRVLIIKPSSLGDIIHALPAVSLIRRRYPDAHLAWLVNDGFTSLLQNCPLVDEIIPFPRHEFRKLPALVKRLRKNRYNLVVDFQGLLRSGLLAVATGAGRRVGFAAPLAREGARFAYNETVPVTCPHAVDRNLLIARHLGCDMTVPIEFPLGTTDACRQSAAALLVGIAAPIAINPASRWPTKFWGDDKFAALIRQLPAERIILTGAANEAERIAGIAPLCRNLAGKTDLAQLTEVYRRCSVVITNDSGPMHLAAAVGTPVVAIFGPTDPSLTGPYGKQHRVLRAGIACSPCHSQQCRHAPRMECMDQVTVEQVLAAVRPSL